MSRSSIEELLAGYRPGQEQELRGHAFLMAIFASLSTTFVLWLRRSGRKLPDHVATGDLLLIAVATHKAARLIAKDRVTSPLRAPFTRFQGSAGPAEVSEEPRGRGLRRSVGELVSCPYCLGMWIASAFVAGLIVAPRATRAFASVLAAVTGSDLLQIAYKKAEETLSE